MSQNVNKNDNGDPRMPPHNDSFKLNYYDKWEISIYTGVIHNDVTCDVCDVDEITGIRWKCITCYNYDLCTRCYMFDEHNLDHCFARIDAPRQTGLVIIQDFTSTCDVYASVA